MTRQGIDVSKHQGTIDWLKVKASGRAEFAVLRAGFGRLASQKDAMFETNYAACKAQGIPVGAYWYSYATGVEEAKEEAQACLSVLKGRQLEYPIFYDIEESKTLKLGKTACTQIARAFLDTLENAGYFVGLYSSKSHLETYFTEEIRARYAIWAAHYGVSKTTYSGAFGMWQKSSEGSIPGISGNVDLDECYVDYPAAIRAKGLNGFTAESGKATGVDYIGTITVDGKTYRVKLEEIT